MLDAVAHPLQSIAFFRQSRSSFRTDDVYFGEKFTYATRAPILIRIAQFLKRGFTVNVRHCLFPYVTESANTCSGSISDVPSFTPFGLFPIHPDHSLQRRRQPLALSVAWLPLFCSIPADPAGTELSVTVFSGAHSSRHFSDHN